LNTTNRENERAYMAIGWKDREASLYCHRGPISKTSGQDKERITFREKKGKGKQILILDGEKELWPPPARKVQR